MKYLVVSILGWVLVILGVVCNAIGQIHEIQDMINGGIFTIVIGFITTLIFLIIYINDRRDK
jgi:hypothetical protein